MNFKITKKQFLFVVIFTMLSVIASKINFSSIVGMENQHFTLFQFFGPIAGGFLGAILGPISVLFAQLINWIFLSTEITTIEVLRLFPMMFAAFYFGKLKEGFKFKVLDYLIAPLCMLLFVLHPQGRIAWIYSLYWITPIVANFYRNSVFMRSLGATFTAHAIGSVTFIYTTNMASNLWVGLIPQVAVERLLFASGIAISYILINSLLDYLSNKVDLKLLDIDKRFIISRYIAKLNFSK